MLGLRGGPFELERFLNDRALLDLNLAGISFLGCNYFHCVVRKAKPFLVGWHFSFPPKPFFA